MTMLAVLKSTTNSSTWCPQFAKISSRKLTTKRSNLEVSNKCTVKPVGKNVKSMKSRLKINVNVAPMKLQPKIKRLPTAFWSVRRH